VGGAATLTDPEGLPIRTHAFATDHESLVKAMDAEIAFYFPSVTMRREAAIKVGGFREPFKIGEDYDICLRLSDLGRVGNVPDVVLFYRQHMTSTVNSGRARSYAYAKVVRELAKERKTTGTDRLMRGEKIEITFEGLPTVKQNAVETYRRWGWWALNDGHRATARKYALKALAGEPMSGESWRLMACVMRGR
jgi:GT2 family glycosyltransferase